MVLPVPESPKNSAVTPSAPMLAEQCMGNTSRCGSTKFITPKMDFFISPAYCVPPISTSFLVKLTSTKYFGVGAVALGIGQEAGRADDGELGLVGLQLFGESAG